MLYRKDILEELLALLSRILNSIEAGLTSQLFAWGNMQARPGTKLRSRQVTRSACFPAQQMVGKFVENSLHKKEGFCVSKTASSAC